jgi:tRNA 5-methylaminomethyl-2-thiouridine biosynthesis bifunctional protein
VETSRYRCCLTDPETAMSLHEAALTPADIDWSLGTTPRSQVFGDIYYSPEDGLAESQHVFLAGNRLSERWQALPKDGPNHFTIAETGFGTGLNFLAAWHGWQAHAPKQSILHYLAVEKHPLRLCDLRSALAAFPSLEKLSLELISRYPPLTPGFHRLTLGQGQVELTLMFGDAIPCLEQAVCQVNAWFLDGFAPACNPQMWQPALFECMARMSAVNASFATFTAAGEIRRRLAAVGFTVERTAGFGRKREMLIGQWRPAPLDSTTTKSTSAPRLSAEQTPWFSSTLTPLPEKSALIIGAGLSGAAAAFSLARRGFQVNVLERLPGPAGDTSGNPQGTTYTRFSTNLTPQNRFYHQAYLHAVNHLPHWLGASHARPGQDYDCGHVVHLSHNEEETQLHSAAVASGLWPEEVIEYLDAARMSEYIGQNCALGGILLTAGLWLSPGNLVGYWLAHPSIQCHYDFDVRSLSRSAEGQWLATSQDGRQMRAAIAILANSLAATDLEAAHPLPLRSVRGQISVLPATPMSKKLQHAVNYEGYITPARDGRHCIGATFTPRSTERDIQEEDHRTNLANLQRTLPELATELGIAECIDQRDTPLPENLTGRTGLRCQTPDYLPIVGPVPDWAAYEEQYANLRHGNLKAGFEAARYQPGLLVSLSHGSRGLTSPALSAEILASYITGEPFPVDREVLHALHPGRFLIRALKKRQV